MSIRRWSCSTSVRSASSSKIEGIGAALPEAEKPELRAALVVSALLGVTVAHRLLGLTPLRDAPAQQIATRLRPAVSAWIEPGGSRTE